MSRLRWGSRGTDAVLLALLLLGFPAVCPVPVGRRTFFRVLLRPVPPWSLGQTRERACFPGYGIDLDGFSLGPIALAREVWSR